VHLLFSFRRKRSKEFFTHATEAIADRFYLNIQDRFQAAMFSLALPTAFLAEAHENES